MPGSSVPPATFGPQGFVAPQESDILNGMLADLNAAFGGGLNTSLSSPQGQLAMTQAAVLAATLELFVSITNGVDPAFATGRMQDAIARIYFLERHPATSTQVVAACVGAAGTVIPAGALAQAADGNLYGCVASGTIPIGGSINLTFACQAVGPIACPAGSLATIYQAVPGWDTILNAADGVLGNNVESPAAFEARRGQSVAKNSQGPVGAIQGAVLSVPGVTDAYTIDNPNSTNLVVGPVTVAPHSIYCCVAGGVPQAIGQAIFSKKAPGANYTGATSVTVQDTNPAYTSPFPSYTVKYQTAAALPIFFAVSIVNSSAAPVDAVTQVQNAIISAFAGQDGGPRPTIGSNILALRFVNAIASLGSWAQVEALTIGTTVTPTGASVAVPIDHVPTVTAAHIAVSLV